MTVDWIINSCKVNSLAFQLQRPVLPGCEWLSISRSVNPLQDDLHRSRLPQPLLCPLLELDGRQLVLKPRVYLGSSLFCYEAVDLLLLEAVHVGAIVFIGNSFPFSFLLDNLIPQLILRHRHLSPDSQSPRRLFIGL